MPRQVFQFPAIEISKAPSVLHTIIVAMMKLSPSFASCFLAFAVWARVGFAAPSDCTSFSDSLVEFSSSFQQPSPPLVQNEFRAQFFQHKW